LDEILQALKDLRATMQEQNDMLLMLLKPQAEVQEQTEKLRSNEVNPKSGYVPVAKPGPRTPPKGSGLKAR
jgi:hypothetical protein